MTFQRRRVTIAACSHLFACWATQANLVGWCTANTRQRRVFSQILSPSPVTTSKNACFVLISQAVRQKSWENSEWVLAADPQLSCFLIALVQLQLFYTANFILLTAPETLSVLPILLRYSPKQAHRGRSGKFLEILLTSGIRILTRMCPKREMADKNRILAFLDCFLRSQLSQMRYDAAWC